MEDGKYPPPIELILFNIILLCILYIQIYDLFSDHVAESKGTGWLPSFRASPPRPPTASRSFWLPSGFILKFSYLWDKKIIMFRDILHKLKIFFCDDDVEKIYVMYSTVIRNNEIHSKIKDRTGLSIRHIIRIINHTKVEEI